MQVLKLDGTRVHAMCVVQDPCMHWGRDPFDDGHMDHLNG